MTKETEDFERNRLHQVSAAFRRWWEDALRKAAEQQAERDEKRAA